MPERPLPPVEQVRPGLWSIPVPIPNNPLRYVITYALETDRGPYLVDAGWNTEESWNVLCRGLRQAGFDVANVQGVLVTHIHPDHYGLAGRIREASGAWVALHQADADLIHDRYEQPADLLDRVAAMLRRVGAPQEELDSLRNASMPVLPFVVAQQPDVLLDDGERVDVPGWDVRAVWTPGHTPGHLCFWETRNRLMLAGDHVLPRITPNISINPQSGDDPLGDFLQSLEKLMPYDADEVLPAHEYRFVGLQDRLVELREHHEHRFAEVLTAIREGSVTAWEITARMRWSRPWDRIEGFMRRAAVGEAVAHLRALERRGVIRPVEGEPVVWEIVEEAQHA